MIDWCNVKYELPTDGKRCLGYCNVIFDKNNSWTGVVDVFFLRSTGWFRCESQERISVKYWADYPDEPEESDDNKNILLYKIKSDHKEMSDELLKCLKKLNNLKD